MEVKNFNNTKSLSTYFITPVFRSNFPMEIPINVSPVSTEDDHKLKRHVKDIIETNLST